MAAIFLKEFWPQIVGDQLATSTGPRRVRKRTLETGVPTRDWDLALQEMTKPLMNNVNEFWSRSLGYCLDFRVVQP